MLNVFKYFDKQFDTFKLWALLCYHAILFYIISGSTPHKEVLSNKKISIYHLKEPPKAIQSEYHPMLKVTDQCVYIDQSYIKCGKSSVGLIGSRTCINI
jgi:hypothetical protein